MEQPQSETSPMPLHTLVASHDIFTAFDAPTLSQLADELELVQLKEGDILFRQGDAGDAMYIIVRGLLRVTVQNEAGKEAVLDVLDPGASVGELALLTGQPRSATVAAVGDTELVKLSKTGFDRLAMQRSDIMQEFAAAVVPRWRRVQLASALKRMFGSLDPAALHSLQAEMEWIHLAGGELLVREGEAGDAMYLVVNGRVRIVAQRPDGHEETLDELGRGETVGEFALLTGEPRLATVYATRDTDLVKLSRELFERLHQRYPQAMLELNRSIIRRAQRALSAAPRHNTRAGTFAIIPIGGRVDPAFAARLAETLTFFGPTLFLTSERFDELYGREGAAQTHPDHPIDISIVGWLTEQESHHPFVIYHADPEWTPWTQRCLRQADRILLVAQADGDPQLSRIETIMHRQNVRPRSELVLLHASETDRPRGTRHWLEPRSVHSHHHIRIGDELHLQRLARRLADRMVGLVLSGGGARGFAHVGVLRALTEADIPIDAIGGTSMGSLIGAAYAMGWDYDRIYQLAKTFASPKQLFDRTLPLVSLMTSEKVTRLLQHLFEDVQIEDLWHPFFCVSCDLTRAEPLIHRSGSLWHAVRASTAIPGIFSPLVHNGSVLVDGGVVNHFPIDIMRGECDGGIVIAVNSSPHTEKLKNYDFGPSISGWHILRSKLLPFGKRNRAPSILATLIRSTEVKSVYDLPRIANLADLMIEPSVEHFRTLQFEAYHDIIQVGYQAGLEHAPALKQRVAAPAR